MSRYKNSKTKENESPSTKIQRQRRGDKEFIRHFETSRLPTPSKALSSLDVVAHVWSVGDRFYKLAQKHYGDPKLWWVIAWYNQKPTEGHVTGGDTVLVPRNITELLSSMGY
jgi:hypothetical protein